jgi:hypothetical protein
MSNEKQESKLHVVSSLMYVGETAAHGLMYLAFAYMAFRIATIFH